jgi:hypothetical protein
VLHHIRHICVSPGNAGSFEGFVEQSSRGAHERFSAPVFIVTRLFPYQHDAGIRPSCTEYSLGGVTVQRASTTASGSVT